MKRRLTVAALSSITLAVLTPAVVAAAVTEADTTVSGLSPFAADCNGAPQPGSAFRNSEIEPYVAPNPTNPDNLVAVYMQDRWSNRGANGHLTSVSFDGGQTWEQLSLADQPAFSRCTGGSAAGGGDFERAADPWVSFGPDGVAYQAAVGFNMTDADQGTMVSTSSDGGRTWGPVAMLNRESDPDVSNERAAVTADPSKAGVAYVV